MRTLTVLSPLLLIILFSSLSFADNADLDHVKEYISCADQNKKKNILMADSCIRAAIELCQANNFLDELGDSYNIKAVLLKNQKKYEEALIFLEKSNRIFSKQKNFVGIAKAKVNKATNHRYLGNIDSTIILLEEALIDVRKSDTPSDYLKISILNNLAIHYTNAGQKSDAMKNLLQADQICLASKDSKVTKLRSFICNGIGSLFGDLKNPHQSIAYFQKAIDASPEDSPSIFSYYNNMAHVMIDIGKIDSAEIVYRSVIKNEKATIASKAHSYSGLSKIYTRLKNYELLKKSAQEGMSIIKDEKDKKNAVIRTDLLGHLGNAEYYLGNYSLAKQHLTKALDSAQKLKVNKHITKLKKLLLITDLRLTNQNKLADDFVAYADEQDTLYQNQVNKDIADLETKYTKALDQQKIAEQNLEIEKQQSSNNRKNAGILGLLLLGAIGGFSAYRFRKKNQEIQLLNRELSHRVKNNLEFISSLLKLQSRELKDAGSKEALKDSENRIQALSSVYKRLYGDDGIVPINLQEYLTELTDNLKETYQTEDRDLKIEMHANKLLVPAEKATKIGLIVNELVTNSIKYAFQDQSDPVIKVAFQKNKEELQLHFSDNGVGAENKTEDESREKSFGLGLVEKLVKQLSGSMQTQNKDGLAYEFSFKGF